MFGIGFGELVLILVIAILLLKPEDAPKIMEQIGLKIFQIKRYFSILKNDKSHY